MLFTFVSCKDHSEYRVGGQFVDYLNRFETQASARGRNFDLKSNGIIIEFADLKNDQAGLCHYEDPIRIEVDKTYWNAITEKVGADLMKEDLIFHELGHGLLNRSHINTTLENGDWKSIMCGGDKVGDRPWNINYKGMRRTYYLEELFNESTAEPDFASTQFVADTTGFSPTLRMNFNSESQSGIIITEVADYKTSIDNGRLRLESKGDNAVMLSASMKIDIQSDFSYQLTMEFTAGDAAGQYGMAFGTISSKTSVYPESMEYFTINNNRKMFMGNNSWYSYYTELYKPEQIIPNKTNTLKVMKIGVMLYYFINNVYCYSSEIEAKNPGDNFGFMVPLKSVVYFDNLIISQKKNSGVSSNVKQNQPLNFEITTVNPLIQNKILNR